MILTDDECRKVYTEAMELPVRNAVAVTRHIESAILDKLRQGVAIANSAILARGRFHAFKGEDGEPDDWEWFEEGTNCEHGCIDAVIVRADAITAPQPAQPSEPAQPEYFAQYEYALDFSVLVAVYRRRADQTPELIHKEALPKQIGDGQPAQPEQGELAGPDQIEKIVDRYVDEYEFTDGENAYHSPNEFEQMLIKDAFYGLLVDEEWDAAWGAHIASLQSAQPEQGPST